MAYETVKKELEDRLSRLQARLVSIKKDATQPHSGDAEDRAQERENDEVVDAIGIETAHTIKVVQSAINKIDNGSYGFCITCKEDIGEKRLQVIPETAQCVGCAQ
ncbi:MAG: RNA polymerase-binding transcription factor DksA [Alcanivorax sp.]|jgi:RNA polymerase-binding transcription factor DksA